MNQPQLRPDPEYRRAFTDVMVKLQNMIGVRPNGKPVAVCVAGGAAMHFYTGARFSNDIDARVMARVLLDPDALQASYRDPQGKVRVLYFDTQYNDSYALLHADAYDDALAIDLEGIDASRLVVKLLTPIDLAISKLARFSEQDQGDIRQLAKHGLIDGDSLRRRALDALPDYVGNLERITNSIEIAATKLCERK